MLMRHYKCIVYCAQVKIFKIFNRILLQNTIEVHLRMHLISLYHLCSFLRTLTFTHILSYYNTQTDFFLTE